MKYTCPVCDYPDLETDPIERFFNICPQCGTEFGYSDFSKSHAELRAEWIAGGRKWWSESKPDPAIVDALRGVK